MTTLEYWEEREKAHAEQVKLEDDVLAKRIRDRMDVLMVEMDKQINGFYSRYAKTEGITMADAQQKVSKMDVKAFETKAAKYVKDKDFSKQANDELKLYNATMKINRLEMLKAEMGLEMVDAFSDVESTMSEGLTQRTFDEFERQAGILGVHNENMTRKVDSIVNGELNNATWSQRIWMYQGMLKNSLADLLTNGIIQGKNPRDLSRDLVKTFGVTKSNAERLMRTEMCRVQTEAQMESFKENGFERYMFISTEGTRPWFQEQDGEFIQIGVKHDSKTCPVCSELNGKIFMVSERQAGKNAPPMHPNCRCSTAAFMDRDDVEQEALNNVQGEEVTDEYLRKAAPGIGIIEQDAEYDEKAHSAEIEFANWLHKKLGGDIRLLQETNRQNEKTADYIWKGQLWDHKAVSTEKAPNSAIRHGLQQIRNNPGGIFLDFANHHVDLTEVWKTIEQRMQWNKLPQVDIFLLVNGEITVKRYRT